MPIILAVNGVVETYPIKPVGPRNGRAESVGEREHHGQQSSSLDRSAWLRKQLINSRATNGHT